MLVREAIDMDVSILDKIGNTPVIPLRKIGRKTGRVIHAKAEMLNPGGSIKDRLAKSLIEAAEKRGDITPGGTIIEVTSGNTGIAVAWICAARGYKAKLVMSDKNSQEKQNMMKLFGAELVLTPHTAQPDDPESNYSTAERLAREIEGSLYLDQYNNPANIQCHYETTGREIWDQTDGNVDCIIAGAGTGGTVSGAGKYLKEKNSSVMVVAVDSVGSIFKPYFDSGRMIKPRHYEVEGIGSDKLVGAMDFNYVDRFEAVSDEEAFKVTRELAAVEGLFCGGSSGAIIAAARRILDESPGIRYPVIILPDSGNRYLSKLYNDEWMRKMGYSNWA
jgi:cystathionine beta-synthase